MVGPAIAIAGSVTAVVCGFLLLGKPLGLFAVLFLLTMWPSLEAVQRIRKFRRATRRREEDLCVHCGYDLTGTTSGVCPECGEGR
jgi:hypothetical protein